MSKTMVSICCITYNHENYIADAIDSFLMQKTNFPIEIIIHDDASTDKTHEIIEAYRKKHPNIVKPIYQSENQYSKGRKISTKIVWPMAIGKYIALCEGDDYWIDSNKLQKQVDYMEKNNGCSRCFHAAEIRTYGESLINKLVKPYNQNHIVDTEDFILGGGGFFPTASLVFRKDLINNLPEFFFKCSVGDFPLVLILSNKGTVYYMDEIMSVYRFELPGAWTYTNLRDGNIEGKIKNCNSDIYILDEFNKYTNNIHNNVISRSILDRRILISNLKQEKFDIKEPRNYELFKNMDMKSRIMLFIGLKSPSVLNILLKLNTMIKLRKS